MFLLAGVVCRVRGGGEGSRLLKFIPPGLKAIFAPEPNADGSNFCSRSVTLAADCGEAANTAQFGSDLMRAARRETLRLAVFL